ncbi:PIG-A like N-acetylglucosaminyl-phosphatidylinositol biosynthetic [Cryptosporidium xiaoi]|uniref:phosphatidylinositol N-acetylglucosaminyltransferase n=1 Tax=Cryptosporidium xiaoi TaxID=659607 RepID=A0AAV9Y1W3_9CRYT
MNIETQPTNFMEFDYGFRHDSKKNDLPNICMVSDFFYPGLGGVEMHIYELSQCLMLRGYKVIVVTHSRNDRYGVRYMGIGLKVYYLPYKTIYDNVIYPSLFTLFPLFRQILIREQIDIVHGHQSVSMLALECLFHAVTMGYRVVFTDHSLFGLSNYDSIHVNNFFRISLSCIDNIICVSHTNKKNLIYRSLVSPNNVYVIPNAIDSNDFLPNPNYKSPINNEVIVVSICRMTYRKGVDLLVEIIPRICNSDPNVRFIVGGDGPKKHLLHEMCMKYNLSNRVELLGSVPCAKVCRVLQRGHIFLNTSLTEAFGISIIEAASCGLLVVSSNVGGIPEILPEEILRLSNPSISNMVNELKIAIGIIREGKFDPNTSHKKISAMYSWHDIAKRTEEVYKNSNKVELIGIKERLLRISNTGSVIGKVFALIAVIDYFIWFFLELFYPGKYIEKCIDFPVIN